MTKIPSTIDILKPFRTAAEILLPSTEEKAKRIIPQLMDSIGYDGTLAYAERMVARSQREEDIELWNAVLRRLKEMREHEGDE